MMDREASGLVFAFENAIRHHHAIDIVEDLIVTLGLPVPKILLDAQRQALDEVVSLRNRLRAALIETPLPDSAS